jgi:hypothetical protein
MTYTLYDLSTGQIISVLSTNDRTQIEQYNFIEGSFDGSEYYISNGVAVPIPTNPSTHILKYVFNYSTKAWDLDSTATALKARLFRNKLLSETVDKINPIWYATLTDEQCTELTAYRQALLDVPQQTGFPTQIEWPTKPTWL